MRTSTSKNTPAAQSLSNRAGRRARARVRGAAIASVAALTFAGVGFGATANAASPAGHATAQTTLSGTSNISQSGSVQPARKRTTPTPIPTPTPTPAPTATPTPTASPGWSATASMPTARNRQVSALLTNGHVLVAGGTAGLSAVRYDPSTGMWTAAAPMLRSVLDGSAVTLADGRVLVVGGYSAGTQLYDPANDSWSAGPSLPSALHGTSAGLFPDGRVIVVGRSASEAPAAVRYDPAKNSVSTLPSPSLPSQIGPEVGVMLPNGSFFTTFGSTTSIYTPATNRWTSFPRPPAALPDKLAIALRPNGNVIIAGGTNWGFGFPTPVKTVQELNPTTRTWKVDQNLPRDYQYPSSYLFDGSELVALGNGQILATGGDAASDQDYRYDPKTDQWTAIPGRNAHGGTVIGLADGSVLVAGGYVDTAFPSLGAVTDQAYVFTP